MQERVVLGHGGGCSRDRVLRVGVVVGVVLRRSGRQMWLVGHAAIFFTKSGQGAFACTDHLNFFAARS